MSNNDENMEQLKELVLQNRRITIPQVANMVHMPFGSVEKMWKENLKMHHMAAILVPKSAGWLSLSVNFWLKNKITIVSHPLYSRLTAM